MLAWVVKRKTRGGRMTFDGLSFVLGAIVGLIFAILVVVAVIAFTE